MALVDLSEQGKAIVVLVINLIATAVLGFGGILGWDLSLWVPITSMVVIILDTVLGIVWVVPHKR